MEINKLIELDGFKSLKRNRNSKTYTATLYGKRIKTPNGHSFEKDIKATGETPELAILNLTKNNE